MQNKHHYRIIKKTYADGNEEYTPQYKWGWWWWFSWKRAVGYDYEVVVRFPTEQEAQKFINAVIAHCRQEELANKVVSKETLPYL